MRLKPALKIVYSNAASQCSNPDGEFEVQAIAGKGPFRFSIHEEKLQFEGVFKNLFAGEYKVKVTDANNCGGFLKVKVLPASGVFQANAVVYPDNGCSTNWGRILVKAHEGVKPFQFQLEDQPYQTDSVFLRT